ncbi:hypothetical protein CEUSTIGMA_g8573.t1, partial [Chlamydomonas eustigma]
WPERCDTYPGVFYGQNDVTAILEADDASFKKLLGRVVEMEVWEEAQESIRKERLQLSKQASAVDGAVTALKDQLPAALKEMETVQRQEQQWREEQQTALAAATAERDAALKKADGLTGPLSQSDQSLHLALGVLPGWMLKAQQQFEASSRPSIEEEQPPPPASVPLPDILRTGSGSGVSSATAHPTWTVQQPSLAGGDARVGNRVGGNVNTKAGLWASVEQQQWYLDLQQERLEVEQHHQQWMVQQRQDMETSFEPIKLKHNEAVNAAESAVQQQQLVVSDLKARVALTSGQLQKAKLGLKNAQKASLGLQHSHQGMHKEVSADHDIKAYIASSSKANGTATKTPVEDEVEGSTLVISASEPAAAAVRPVVCDACLQEINAEQLERKIEQMQEELQQLIKSNKVAEDKHMAMELERVRAVAALQMAVENHQSQMAEASALEQKRVHATLQDLRQREVNGRARAEEEWMELQSQLQRQREEWEARRSQALAAWRKEEEEAKRQWQQQQQSAAIARAERLSKLQAAQSLQGDLALAQRQLMLAVQSINELRLRHPELSEKMALPIGDPNNHQPPAVSEQLILTREEQKEALLRYNKEVQSVGAGVRGLESALLRFKQFSERCKVLARGENPFTRQLQSVETRLSKLQHSISEQQKVQQLQRQQIQNFEEVEKALGRGGIPSFVLEGVLGELQARTATFLEQLSDSMVLELSATTPGVSRGGKSLPTVSKRGGSSSAADGSSSSSSSRDKEEIFKVVKVRVKEQMIPRSLSQLSGGERRRVALALALGFADLLRCRGRLSSNILVLDEVLQQLDGEGCSRLADVLRGLPHDSILVVGQANSYVTQVFDVMDVVVKRDGSSHIISA